jgi:Icc-related predicted phosphoesterase
MDVDVQYSNYTDDFFGDGEYVNLYGSRKKKKEREEKKRFDPLLITGGITAATVYVGSTLFKRKKNLEEKRRVAEREAERLRLESEKLIAEGKAAEAKAKADEAQAKAAQAEADKKSLEALQPKETIIESTVVAQPQKKTGKFVPYIIGGVILIGGLIYFLRKK